MLLLFVISVSMCFAASSGAEDAEIASNINDNVVAGELSDLRRYSDDLPDSFYFIWIFGKYIPVPTRIQVYSNAGKRFSLGEFGEFPGGSYRGHSALDEEMITRVEMGERGNCGEYCSSLTDDTRQFLKLEREFNIGDITGREYVVISDQATASLVFMDDDEYMVIGSSRAGWKELWIEIMKWGQSD